MLFETFGRIPSIEGTVISSSPAKANPDSREVAILINNPFGLSLGVGI
jgi:hypothetical protein